jgi:hypothetical protein
MGRIRANGVLYTVAQRLICARIWLAALFE